MTKTSCTLTWTPPLDDGGSPLTQYVVERREAGRKMWTKLSSDVKPDITKYNVTKLVEGREYEFKVMLV